MALESALWKSLRQIMDPTRYPTFATRVHLERVENGVGEGFPDVDGFVRGWGPIQFELKSAARPVRSSTPIRFKVRPLQPPWNIRRWLAGGNNWWLLQVGEGHDRSVILAPGWLDIGALRLTESQIEKLATDEGGGVWIGPRWQLPMLERAFIRWEERHNALRHDERNLFA
jgi:hypothetical protein